MRNWSPNQRQTFSSDCAASEEIEIIFVCSFIAFRPLQTPDDTFGDIATYVRSDEMSLSKLYT